MIGHEIKYISSFFPYNIKRFHNPDLIYAHSLLIFGDFGFEDNKDLARAENMERIGNLLAGVELLSLGITFHRFCADDTKTFSLKSNSEGVEKRYNLDLLFGDVFYSRAVPYLLKFKDHKVFEIILRSLKKTHGNRLELHQRLIKFIGGSSKVVSMIKKNEDLFIGINSLLRISCPRRNSTQKGVTGRAPGRERPFHARQSRLAWMEA